MYKALLENLVIEALVRINEPVVQILCREQDLQLVNSVRQNRHFGTTERSSSFHPLSLCSPFPAERSPRSRSDACLLQVLPSAKQKFQAAANAANLDYLEAVKKKCEITVVRSAFLPKGPELVNNSELPSWCVSECLSASNHIVPTALARIVRQWLLCDVLVRAAPCCAQSRRHYCGEPEGQHFMREHPRRSALDRF
eukprot:SAG11_NODE_4514_length_1867_cov_1.665724_1_plen_197_part_00